MDDLLKKTSETGALLGALVMFCGSTLPTPLGAVFSILVSSVWWGVFFDDWILCGYFFKGATECVKYPFAGFMNWKIVFLCSLPYAIVVGSLYNRSRSDDPDNKLHGEYDTWERLLSAFNTFPVLERTILKTVFVLSLPFSGPFIFTLGTVYVAGITFYGLFLWQDVGVTVFVFGALLYFANLLFRTRGVMFLIASLPVFWWEYINWGPTGNGF